MLLVPVGAEVMVKTAGTKRGQTREEVGRLCLTSISQAMLSAIGMFNAAAALFETSSVQS